MNQLLMLLFTFIVLLLFSPAEQVQACKRLEALAAHFFGGTKKSFSNVEVLSEDLNSIVTKLKGEHGDEYVAKTYLTDSKYIADKARFEWLAEFEDIFSEMKVDIVSRAYSQSMPRTVFMDYVKPRTAHDYLLGLGDGSVQKQKMQSSFNETFRKLAEDICERHSCKVKVISGKQFYRSRTLDGTYVFDLPVPNLLPKEFRLPQKVIFKSDNIVFNPRTKRWTLFDPF